MPLFFLWVGVSGAQGVVHERTHLSFPFPRFAVAGAVPLALPRPLPPRALLPRALLPRPRLGGGDGCASSSLSLFSSLVASRASCSSSSSAAGRLRLFATSSASETPRLHAGVMVAGAVLRTAPLRVFERGAVETAAFERVFMIVGTGEAGGKGRNNRWTLPRRVRFRNGNRQQPRLD